MKTKIIIENWTKLNTEEYRQVVNLKFIPRIGERITFEIEDSEGNYEDNYFVVDIVNQFVDGFHNIVVIISDDLECVSRFYYKETN